jgi:hypothetical protein
MLSALNLENEPVRLCVVANALVRRQGSKINAWIYIVVVLKEHKNREE